MTRPPSTEDLEREWAPVDRAIDDALGTPRWHEIATEGLPPTWTFVSTWDAECPNGGVGYLQLHLPDDAEDENAAPVWHDDHGHRADRGVTHWYPLPAPPTKEPR